MALIYFDASALVKLLQDEAGSDETWAVWDVADARLSSRLVVPEVRAALAAAHRNHVLSDADFAIAEAEWATLRLRLRPIELTALVADGAGDLAGPHALKGVDAVHLASALAVAEADPIVAVWDRRLHAACTAAGLRVAPAEL